MLRNSLIVTSNYKLKFFWISNLFCPVMVLMEFPFLEIFGTTSSCIFPVFIVLVLSSWEFVDFLGLLDIWLIYNILQTNNLLHQWLLSFAYDFYCLVNLCIIVLFIVNKFPIYSTFLVFFLTLLFCNVIGIANMMSLTFFSTIITNFL